MSILKDEQESTDLTPPKWVIFFACIRLALDNCPSRYCTKLKVKFRPTYSDLKTNIQRLSIHRTLFSCINNFLASFVIEIL